MVVTTKKKPGSTSCDRLRIRNNRHCARLLDEGSEQHHAKRKVDRIAEAKARKVISHPKAKI
jgi:hypothetical protein